MRDGKGFMLVYNVTSRNTFDEVVRLRDKILRTKEDERIPIVLVGNKCDLSSERVVETKEGEELAKQWGVKFYETSAKLKLNNEICFHQLVRDMRKYEEQNALKAQKTKKTSKFGFCTIL